MEQWCPEQKIVSHCLHVCFHLNLSVLCFNSRCSCACMIVHASTFRERRLIVSQVVKHQYFGPQPKYQAQMCAGTPDKIMRNMSTF